MVPMTSVSTPVLWLTDDLSVTHGHLRFVIVVSTDGFTLPFFVNAPGLFVELANPGPELGAAALRA